MNELQRNEEAVSAAIATVLLFGGVLSIISIMMVTMIPVIEELEGSVERHDMAAQNDTIQSTDHEFSRARYAWRHGNPRICSSGWFT